MALQEVCEGIKIGRMPGGMQLAWPWAFCCAALLSSRYLLVLGMAYVGLCVCTVRVHHQGLTDLSQLRYACDQPVYAEGISIRPYCVTRKVKSNVTVKDRIR